MSSATDHTFDINKARADLAAYGKGEPCHNTRVSRYIDCSRTHLATVAPNDAHGQVRYAERMQVRMPKRA